MEKRRQTLIKLHAIQRYCIWHYFQPFINNVRICEFPKSGGTWLGQMLSELLEKEFPRNTALPFRSCIQHSHYQGPTKFKTIVVVRDGRDVMTSAYYHFLIYAPNRPSFLISKWREKLGRCDFENVRETMPTFIEKFTNEFRIGGLKTCWSEHVLSFDFESDHYLRVKYENLIRQPRVELNRILKWLNMEAMSNVDDVIEKFSFESQTNRMPGEEDPLSFMRKGISGDWKNYFSEEALMMFKKYHSPGLKKMGYD